MAKLEVFLNYDRDAVSSIRVPGVRKLKIVRPTGKKPIRSFHNLFVLECPEHDERSPTAFVPAFAFEKDGPGIPCGRVKVCILCWKLLEKEA